MKKTNLLYGNTADNIKISFVITTYRRDEFIFDAINSIVHQPDFDQYQIEILVISNDPKDDMADLIAEFKDYPISVYVNEENYGMIANVNLGAQKAKGEYIAFLHDDDFLLDNYLKEMVPLIDGEYDCYVPSRYHLTHKKIRNYFSAAFKVLYFPWRIGAAVTPVTLSDVLNCWQDIYRAPSCGVVFRKRALEEYGYFKDESGLSWDYYNFREFNRNHKIGFVHKYVSVYRTYSGLSNSEKTKRNFFEDRDTLLKTEKDNYPFLQKYYNEINYFNHKIIGETIDVDKKRYLLFVLSINSYNIRHRLDIFKATTDTSLERWWNR